MLEMRSGHGSKSSGSDQINTQNQVRNLRSLRVRLDQHSRLGQVMDQRALGWIGLASAVGVLVAGGADTDRVVPASGWHRPLLLWARPTYALATRPTVVQLQQWAERLAADAAVYDRVVRLPVRRTCRIPQCHWNHKHAQDYSRLLSNRTIFSADDSRLGRIPHIGLPKKLIRGLLLQDIFTDRMPLPVIHLTLWNSFNGIFQDNSSKPGTECLQSGFYCTNGWRRRWWQPQL